MSEELVRILPFSVDMSKPIEKTELHELFVMGDSLAHRFELEFTRGGEAVSLSGCTVSGYFTNFAEDITVKVDGEVKNGKAAVTLSDPCYTMHGQFVLTIQIIGGGVDASVFCGEGFMRNTKTETIIYDDYVIYDVSTLLAHIGAMKTATQEAQTATNAANTAAGTANTAAGKIENMTVSATSGTIADASVSEKNSAKHIAFVLPQGEKGDPGNTPYIGENGNWWVGDEDTGTRAQGPAGQNGTGAGTVKAVKVGSTTHEPDATGVVDIGDLSIYAPVRGTDYWTEADIAEIRSYVDDAILGGAW